MRRYAPHLSMYALWPTYFDSLKLTRLLHPRQQSYKLRDLLVLLQLEGTNSHLANDDIMATLSLMVHCYDCARSVSGRQLEFLSRHRRMAQRFRLLYADLFMHTRRQMYQEGASTEADGQPGRSALSSELLYAYHYLQERNLTPQLPKLHYIIRYIDIDLLTPESGQSLASQLARHYSDLCTMKEADLCGAASMPERVFVSTVHKAKGLEFDTVIVYDAVDGKYPSPYASNDAKQGEEARKFYVAITRAKRRLIVSTCRNAISRWGAWYAKVLTPYMQSVISCFKP